jgi:DNA-binding CsgD family transcriptional regulator
VAAEDAVRWRESATAQLEASHQARSAGDLAAAMRLTEHAHAAFVTAGDVGPALSCAALLMADNSMTGDFAAAHAWEQRGLRLLRRRKDYVERGYLALGYFACDIKDPHDLMHRAELALGLAARFHDGELQLRAEADKGLALIGTGQVDAGFVLLDSVMAAVAAREMENAVTLRMTVCTALTACERTGDAARAEYWVSLTEHDPALQQDPATIAHCELLRGGVAAMMGQWNEAERRLANAMQADQTLASHRAAARAKLAELRIQQGSCDEAEQLIDGMEGWVETAMAAARLRLARAEHDQAAALLRGVIRDLGDDCIRVAPALAALADVHLQRDDVHSAERTARQLRVLSERCESDEIQALVHLTRGRLALHAADIVAAIAELEQALQLLVHLDRPLLSAQISLELSRALTLSEDRAGAEVEAVAAVATFEKLGMVPDLALAQAMIAALPELSVEDGAKHHPSADDEPLTPREMEVARLVAEGLTNREIAGALMLSVRTVENHVDRALGKLGFRTRSRLASWVREQ